MLFSVHNLVYYDCVSSFQVISERDILGTQLVRRNDELALLYEKIKIQQSTLNKGDEVVNKSMFVSGPR